MFLKYISIYTNYTYLKFFKNVDTKYKSNQSSQSMEIPGENLMQLTAIWIAITVFMA